MRNYFHALQLQTNATRDVITEALGLGNSTANALAPKQRVDAYEIMLDEERLSVYARTCQVYEALYCASECLHSAEGVDTHRWQDRLAQFATDHAEQLDDFSRT